MQPVYSMTDLNMLLFFAKAPPLAMCGFRHLHIDVPNWLDRLPLNDTVLVAKRAWRPFPHTKIKSLRIGIASAAKHRVEDIGTLKLIERTNSGVLSNYCIHFQKNAVEVGIQIPHFPRPRTEQKLAISQFANFRSLEPIATGSALESKEL